jgi:hypothetical protein
MKRSISMRSSPKELLASALLSWKPSRACTIIKREGQGAGSREQGAGSREQGAARTGIRIKIFDNVERRVYTKQAERCNATNKRTVDAARIGRHTKLSIP